MSLKKWSLIDRPVGPQALPIWCRGVHIDWMDGYGNWPRVLFKVSENIFDWPEQRWTHSTDGVYSTTHADGRGKCHYHRGAVSPTMLREFVNGEWAEVERLATTQQDGYAGRSFTLPMDDGTEIVLRGPWHGSPLPGYVEATIVEITTKDRARRPWHRMGGYFGMTFTEDLFIRLLARFAPHIELARVTYDWGFTQIEPIDPRHGGLPKRAYLDKQRETEPA